MKITRDNIRGLLEKLDEMDAATQELRDNADDWVEKADDWYDDSYKADSEWRRYEIQIARNGLEAHMDKFVDALAFMYDYIHEGRWAEIEHGRHHVNAKSEK